MNTNYIIKKLQSKTMNQILLTEILYELKGCKITMENIKEALKNNGFEKIKDKNITIKKFNDNYCEISILNNSILVKTNDFGIINYILI